MLLITDEVQTGFGRTGGDVAIEHWDVEPDIMTMAKSLANGTPTGAFITNDRIASSYTRPGASTTGGNPVSAAAALATIAVIEKYQLVQRAKDLGDYFKDRLRTLQKSHILVGDVRGKGLMLGVELVKRIKPPQQKK